MSVPTVRVSKLREHLDIAAPTPAEVDACARAAPFCWAGSALATSPRWGHGTRRDVGHALLVNDRARELREPWSHLLSVRVDIACDEGAGCDIPMAYLKRLPRKDVLDALNAWTWAGYEIRLGYELAGGAVQSDRNWIVRAMGARGDGQELAYYARIDERDGKKLLWLQAIGIDLENDGARRWVADRLRAHIAAARTVYGLGTLAHVGIKSGQLDRAGGWRFAPGSDLTGPCYLIGGYYDAADLGRWYREIFDALGFASVVTNENPRHLDRGALWGVTPPSSVIGDGLHVSPASATS